MGNARQTGIQHSDNIMGYPNSKVGAGLVPLKDGGSHFPLLEEGKEGVFQIYFTPSLTEWTKAWQWKLIGMRRSRLVSSASIETHLIVAKGHTKDFDDNCRHYLTMMWQSFGTWRVYGS